ncbi:four helix bundle protein [Patescibacteria group bacterium]|nr:four helix bundle protein [Patescibacteria group bacterium]
MQENNQVPNRKEPNKNQNQKNQKFDLEERTLTFATNVIDMINRISNNIQNIEIKKQLIRSATSIGANYREANEALGKKDFVYRLKISRKEAKETIYWLNLLNSNNQPFGPEMNSLIKEAKEFIYIFTSIISKFNS